MKDSAKVYFNPLRIFGFSLAVSFLIGEIIGIKFSLPLIVNLFGLIVLVLFCLIFFISVRIFILHNEKLPPSTPTEKIIKSSIYSYTRNPIYISFVGFQFSMFLLFENVIYILSSISLFFWIKYYVVSPEEEYLEKKFGIEYKRYKSNVARWFF